MSVAPGCQGRVYGCPACGKRDMTIGETFDHECAQCPKGYALQVYGERQQYSHAPRLNAQGDELCPCCGHDDVAMWADDGEADLADWWKCETFSGGCGAHGAVRQPKARLTLNGLTFPEGR